MSEITEQIGNQIKEARKRRGITQAGLAEMLGVSQVTVNKYETGKQNLTVDTIKRIASALKTDIVITVKA